MAGKGKTIDARLSFKPEFHAKLEAEAKERCMELNQLIGELVEIGLVTLLKGLEVERQDPWRQVGDNSAPLPDMI